MLSNKALLLNSPAPKASWSLTTRSIPTPGPTQLVLRNRALALNPMNHKLADIPGYGAAIGHLTFPAIPGSDQSGLVHSIGSDVTRFAPGERILAMAVPQKGLDHGGFQEYTLIEQHFAAKMPEGVDFRGAATLPVSVLTAAGLLNDAGVKITDGDGAADGKTVLVWGASGSVGKSLVQVAKNLGATVFAVTGPTHVESLRKLGADEVFDYHSTDVAAQIKAVLEKRGVEITTFIDAVCADMSATAKVVARVGGGKLFTLVPWKMAVRDQDPPEGVEVVMSGAPSVLRDADKVGFVMALTEQWLKEGKLRPAMVQSVDGGIEGIEKGLDVLRKGVSGVKLVIDV